MPGNRNNVYCQTILRMLISIAKRIPSYSPWSRPRPLNILHCYTLYCATKRTTACRYISSANDIFSTTRYAYEAWRRQRAFYLFAFQRHLNKTVLLRVNEISLQAEMPPRKNTKLNTVLVRSSNRGKLFPPWNQFV